MQTGILDEVLADNRRGSSDVADVLDKGHDRNGGNQADGTHIELRQEEGRQIQPRSLRNGGEIHHAAADGRHITDDDTNQDGHELEQTLCKERGDEDRRNGNRSHQPVQANVDSADLRGDVVDRGGRQHQTDDGHDGAGDDRRKIRVSTMVITRYSAPATMMPPVA